MIYFGNPIISIESLLSASRVRVSHPSFIPRSKLVPRFSLCPLYIYDTALHLSGLRFSIGPVKRRTDGERTRRGKELRNDQREIRD